jgi:hypothetical protein
MPTQIESGSWGRGRARQPVWPTPVESAQCAVLADRVRRV